MKKIILSLAMAFATTAHAQNLMVETDAIDFGVQPQGAWTPPILVEVFNVGSEIITVTSVEINNSKGNFIQAGCTSRIFPGSTCTIGVQFNPDKGSAFSKILVIEGVVGEDVNDPDAASVSGMIHMKGSGQK